MQTARKVFERTLEEQRAQAQSQVGVLAEDTRIRSTAMMANPDEATVRDVLKDLMATSGAGLMAVLIYVRHADNIGRLVKGQEPRLGAKKT